MIAGWPPLRVLAELIGDRRAGIHDDELADRLDQDAARLGAEADIGDEHVGLIEPGDRADPDHAPLRVVGDDHQPAPRLDERPVGIRLEQVRTAEPGPLVHPVDAHEHQVDMDAPQGRDRERSGQRVRWRPHAAGQDDRLVGCGRSGAAHPPPGPSWSRRSTQERAPTAGRARTSSCRPTPRSPCRAPRAPRPHRRSRPSRSAGAPTSGRSPVRTRRCRRSTSRHRGPSRAVPARRGSRGRDGRSCRRRRARARGPRPGPRRPRGRDRG